MMRKIIILLLSIIFYCGAVSIDKNKYTKNANKYYSDFKKEWEVMPAADKNRIRESYRAGIEHDLGFTMAGTRFLENRGVRTDGNKYAINKNQHKGYVTYDCGDYGINTMTYLKSIGKETKNKSKHIQACKVLSNNKKLNLKMAMSVYSYALDRYDNNILRTWNYYNTGRDKILGNRIYMMKGIVKLLEEEFSKRPVFTRVASN